MVYYVNGSGKPIFIIKHPTTNAKIDEVMFPMTLRPDGLLETHREVSTSVILTSIDSVAGNVKKRKVKAKNGWESTFTFDYSGLATNDTIKNKIKKVQDYESDNYKIFLIPRADDRSRILEVMQVPSSEIDIQIHTGGLKSRGNRGIYLSYVTVHLSKYLPISDPNDIQYSSFYPELFVMEN
jgi:hypothetical protein